MTEEEYIKALVKGFLESDAEDFVGFLMDKCWKDHLKIIQMSGDLGQAFGKIGILESRNPSNPNQQ